MITQSLKLQKRKVIVVSKRLRLDDVEWKEFKIKDLFKIEKVKGKPVDTYTKGETPYTSTASINNAVIDFIEADEDSFSKGNSISVDPIGGNAFYHEYDFVGRGYSGASINILFNKNLNKYNGLFICQAIEITAKYKASYGYLFNSKRLENGLILLPVSTNQVPNWQFMEDYIKQEQKIIAQKVIDYYEQKMLETAFDLVGLEGVEWRNFQIGSLFSFERRPSKGLSHLSIDEKNGISYLGATNKNNGVLDFVKPVSTQAYKGNCIAFIRNGEGAMGYSVYKKEDFMATQDISVGYNENLNQYNGMFITTVADRVRGKYNFGYKRNQSRLEKEILKLPIDQNGNPHWEYMSQFMQKIEAENLEKALEYIYIYIYKIAISKGSDLALLEEKEWKEFWLEDIVTISSGVRLTKSNQEKGQTPFIGSSDSNNGVTAFVSNKNSSLDKNLLGVNYNGSVVETFYHPYEGIFSDDVKRIHWKDRTHENRFTYLFLKQAILQQKEKYAYGYKFNANRMRRQKIMLPVSSDGQADFEYMKAYMQIKEIEKQYDVLKYYYHLQEL